MRGRIEIGSLLFGVHAGPTNRQIRIRYVNEIEKLTPIKSRALPCGKGRIILKTSEIDMEIDYYGGLQHNGRAPLLLFVLFRTTPKSDERVAAKNL